MHCQIFFVPTAFRWQNSLRTFMDLVCRMLITEDFWTGNKIPRISSFEIIINVLNPPYIFCQIPARLHYTLLLLRWKLGNKWLHFWNCFRTISHRFYYRRNCRCLIKILSSRSNISSFCSIAKARATWKGMELQTRRAAIYSQVLQLLYTVSKYCILPKLAASYCRHSAELRVGYVTYNEIVIL